MNNAFDIRILKFGIVGLIGMLIDFSVTWFCKEILGINKFLGNALGFCLAVTSNYILNRTWTFETTASPVAFELTKFIIVSITGLLINSVLLFILVKHIKTNFYLVKLIVTGLVFFWNYFANMLFTFN